VGWETAASTTYTLVSSRYLYGVAEERWNTKRDWKD